jgi:hypothetical protein
MANNKITLKEIVNLWHETQMGHMKKCQEKGAEFADIMWGLYNEYNKEKKDD